MKSPARLLLAASCTAALLSAPTAAWSAEKPKADKTNSVDCTKVKCIALTFDDGPGKYADKLLDTLKKTKSKATFFLEGQYVKSRPAFAKRMAQEGHELGNHSYTHPHLRDLDEDRIREELTRTQEIVKQATGKTPTMLRPPYGELDQRVQAIAKEMRLPIVLWNGGSRDWATKNEKAIYDEVLKNAKRDGVILMHDWVEQTVKVMPKLIAALQKQGYHIVSVSSLRGAGKLEPGDIYPADADLERLSADTPTSEDGPGAAESPADGL
ncbi:polysaccharide deacetylase family protein [Streptosporangium carneum]|uniref:Deacetylase n=1 Tax=Streptosporangium carneum TaxID=47481 RepID=A0A9W6I4I2_9ACTN|nr:polysaccharide deacetylase family protein [Streptosporangium carneum]GLK11927.1 deacetylase [Streptosporangium carneum]